MDGFVKRRDLSTEDRHTGGPPREDEGRDWGDGSTSQGMPKIAGNHQHRGEAWGGFSLTALGGNQLSDAGILHIQPPGV